MNHNFKKNEVRKGHWPQEDHPATGAGAARSPGGGPAPPPPPRPLLVHLSHLDPEAPASALAPRRRRPLVVLRGGAAHRNRFSARPVPQAGGGVLGGQACRLGAGPLGAKPGGDSRPKHQGPGASGAPWAAPSLSSLKPEH